MCRLEKKAHAASADLTISDFEKWAETGSAQIEKDGNIALLLVVKAIVSGMISFFWSESFRLRLCGSNTR